MKILSWNVNGLRAVGRAGFLDWLQSESPDVLCLQEIKCTPGQLEPPFLKPDGYQTIFHPAQKPGYSGVAIYIKKSLSLQSVHEGFELATSIPEKVAATALHEGRILTATFEPFILVNAYFPNSQRDHARLDFKLEFCAAMLQYCDALRKQKKPVILCGDYNIAHKAIDLKNPKANEKTAGFLPAERAWMDAFVAAGWIDTFRHFVQEPDHYTWWSYKPGIRQRNIGWRIDYHCINKEYLHKIKDAFILNKVYGSDHCPVGVIVENEVIY